MRFFAMIIGMAALLLACPGVGHTGSTEGKQRWTFAKYKEPKAKQHPAIEVPRATGNVPGEFKLLIVFKAKEVAEFVVIGDGDTPISLHVYDSNDKLIAKDEDPSHRGSDLCVCEWTPKKEEKFRIVIKNHGEVSNFVLAGCN